MGLTMAENIFYTYKFHILYLYVYKRHANEGSLKYLLLKWQCTGIL